MSVFLAHLRYFASDAMEEWRHSPGPNFLATATLAAVLFVAGLDLLVLANLSSHVGQWKKELRVSVYLVDGADAQVTGELEKTLAGVEGVARVERVDKDEALRRFRAAFPDLAGVPGDLGANPLPASLEVILEPGPGSRAAAEAIDETARAAAVVDEVRYDQALLDRVDALLDVARWGGAALGLLVFTAVAFVVAGVLRLTVYARRDEIEIMRLVGASPLFVRGPFLVAGLAQGLSGGLLAIFVVEAARRTTLAYAGTRNGDLSELVVGRALPVSPALLLVGIGAVLGVVSAWYAVRQAR